MRLAVLSDIHGNLHALEAVLDDLKQAGDVDLIWCLGDLAAFGTRPAECIKRVRDLQEEYTDEKFKVIGGNTDRYLVTGERFKVPPADDADKLKKYVTDFIERDNILNWNLSRLQWEDYEFLTKINGRELRKRVDGYGYVIGVHAIPGDDESNSLRPDTTGEEARDALLDREGRLAIAGHTHLAMDRDLGTWHVINPGSIGLSFSRPGEAEWALLTFEGNSVSVDLRAVDYDVKAMLDDGEQVGHPKIDFLATRTQKA